MAEVPTSVAAAHKLRKMLQQESHMVVAPGVYDGLTARLAIESGAECLYMTGAGTNMSRLGMADLGIATLNDMQANAAMIASLDPFIPLIADADTGYGGPIMVARTVQSYARAGVAGLHIEDQVQEKRCGHLAGKQIVEREVYYSRLRAAVKARKEMGSNMIIIARTDARAASGMQEAIERMKGALKCGADALFLEAMQSREECEEAVSTFKGTPMLLNMVGAGKTPQLDVKDAQAIGFRLMIWPTLALEAVVPALRETFRSLKEHGKEQGQPLGPTKLFEICGLRELIKFDEESGGRTFSSA